ncbi:hypothetical protein ACTTAL_03380 [Rhodobacter capsulatus]|uniref:hypothetical protein n=1 Tax=Rhodobacter capsulatus TaxID=1061 RepID=UPI0003D2E18B|nr:hypothetical protein [Rhodobacter capsulatus]ETD89842.1 hypothetical protein U713_07520 [Rhodobacter capsulatus YW2]
MDTITAAIITQVVLPIVATIVTAIIGWAAAQARARWGIEIEARQREALHQALMTGAQLALARLGPQASQSALTAAAVEYAQGSVPGAMAGLRPASSTLHDLALAKISALIK